VGVAAGGQLDAPEQAEVVAAEVDQIQVTAVTEQQTSAEVAAVDHW
jgi:hypothetical protein